MNGLTGFSRIQKYVLVVTTGRSGSSFFTNMVNDNAENAFSEHEPNVISGDQSTIWYYEDNQAGLNEIVERKLARLKRGEQVASLPVSDTLHGLIRKTPWKGRVPRVPVREIYVEVDNGALKSWGPAFVEAVPQVDIIHLTRDPMVQAKSAENRGSYPNPDRPYFLWPTWERNHLPLSADITAKLSAFQLALWYWIEMETRYAEFFASRTLLELDLEELNDPVRVAQIFDQLGIRHRPLDLGGGRNAGKRESFVTEADCAEARELIALLPAGTLDRISNTYGLKDL
ncbi:hypothetical protein [Primorskyibacter sedentarius]|uniref:hypothetical protein n=1 Tax=Primorskyibacter sedentarius TaxID=745311 RepID=UPI003EB90042